MERSIEKVGASRGAYGWPPPTPTATPQPLSPKRTTQRGFTLLELLIVIGIIGILSGILLATFSGSSESARAAQCLNNMRSLGNAVLACGMATTYYPAAASYYYCHINARGKFTRDNLTRGWVGSYQKETRVISPYYDDKGELQHHAITNGAIWRYIKGGVSSYVCPLHVLESRKAGLTPAWSYVMNSYFGYPYGGKPAPTVDTRRRDYRGNLHYYYSTQNGETSLPRDPSKVLLFAELPFIEQQGVQTANISKGTDDDLDTALQYSAEEADSSFNKAHNCAASGAGEAIGFNHKSGKHGDYMAHVAFADGHVEKIPLRGSAADIKKLTSILCMGYGYTVDASTYEKAE